MFNHTSFKTLLVVFFMSISILNAAQYDKTSYYVAYDVNDTKQFVLVLPSVQKVYTHEAGHIAALDLKPITDQFVTFPTYNNGSLCFSALKNDATGENGASIMENQCYEVKFFYTQKEVVSEGVAFILFYAPAEKVYEGLAGDAESFEVVREGNIVHSENSITGSDYTNFVFDVKTGEVEGVVESDYVDTVAPVITLNGNAFVTVYLGDTYTDAGAIATDNVDSNVEVITSGTVDTSTLGTYTITYIANDDAGNTATSLTRTVYVVQRLTPIEEAKSLFTELRTQAMSVIDYDNNGTPGFLDTEAESMNNALNDVMLNVGYMGDVINVLAEGIDQAYKNSETNISGTPMGGTRVITLDKTAVGSWKYSISEGNVTWQGTIVFPEVIIGDTAENELYTTGVLTLTVNGDVPFDYEGILHSGVIDSQHFEGTVTVSKKITGADISLSGKIASNGTSIELKNANAELAYRESQADAQGNTEPIFDYFKLNEVVLQGIVGGYTIDGSIMVNSYAQNNGLKIKGGIYEESQSGFGIYLYCTDNSTVNDSSVTFQYNGITYQPSGYSYNNYWFDDIPENIQYDDIIENIHYTGYCSGSGTIAYNLNYNWSDTYHSIANSGWLPNDITFTGSIGRTGATLEGTLNAEWFNIVTMDLSADEIPLVKVLFDGSLQMPERPKMLATLSFENNATKNIIGASYNYDATSINLSAVFDSDMNNGDMTITSGTDLVAIMTINNGNLVTDGTGTIKKGDTLVGRLEERAGVPVIKYVDGSFESLP